MSGLWISLRIRHMWRLWYYMEVLRGGPIQSPDEARAALCAVTKEDVRGILRALTLSVSYCLTREEGSTHA